jgi:hypothetical protein
LNLPQIKHGARAPLPPAPWQKPPHFSPKRDLPTSIVASSSAAMAGVENMASAKITALESAHNVTNLERIFESIAVPFLC